MALSLSGLSVPVRGNINAIPNNAFDLMKHIRDRETSGSMRTQVQANRLLKQELQREAIERKLKEAEDYLHTDEGKRRERAYEDRLHMEAEDVFAMQREKALRDAKKLDFRDKIRHEAEQRLKQEEIERQKKLEAAEKRRQAVVDRIRKKKEEEEAAIRRAEEARLREIAEKERAVQQGLERLRSDRSQMEIEDELSILSEQLFKEHLEKMKWKKQEELRLAAWEEEQRKRDEIEAIKRKERLAELEAKKAKLAELRKAQMLSSGNQQEADVKEENRVKDVQQAREDAIKLGKQMRIQNKAKYVSKKRKEEPNPATTKQEHNDSTSLLIRRNSRDGVGGEEHKIQFLRTPSKAELVSSTTSSATEIDPDLINKIENISSGAELSQFQKELMMEKRALRIDLLSKNSQNENQSPNESEENKTKALQNRVNEITTIEKYIQNKMDQLISNKEKPKELLQLSESLQNETTSLQNAILGGNTQPTSTQRTGDEPINQGSKLLSSDDLFSTIEKCLQEANEIIVKYGIFDILSNNKEGDVTPRERAGSTTNVDYVSIIRRATMLRMQLTEFLSKINTGDDIIGYREKITDSVQKISRFIEKHQQMTPQKPPLIRGNSNITPEVLQRINSFTSLDVPNTPPKSRPPKKVVPEGSKDMQLAQSKIEGGEITAATSAIGKKMLNLVRHDEKPAEILPHRLEFDPQHSEESGSDGFVSPRRKVGIAEMRREEKQPARTLLSEDEPYIVSPRTRVSPRLCPVDGHSSQTKAPLKAESKENQPHKNEEKLQNLAPAKDIIMESKTDPQPLISAQKKIQQKPSLHPTAETQRSTISAPVIISSQAKKVNGHIAIEVTDLEDQTSNQSSRKNSYEDKMLRSCDSTASMLSVGVLDGNEATWWGQDQDAAVEKNAEETRKLSPRNGSRSPTDREDEDNWWKQAGALDPQDQNPLDWQPDSVEEETVVEYDENTEFQLEDFDYNSIPGWAECLHTTMATAAHHAAFYGYTKVLEILSYYFDVFQMDKNGRTPLFYASLRNNLDCVLLLVSLDPQWIEVGDSRGDTAIHAAAISNGIEVLSFLITCEVNSNIANYEGLTPVHLAKSTDLLTILYNANSTMYCVDNMSRMPLWYRCKDGNKESVSLLCQLMPIEYITWQDSDGNTPLHIASMSGFDEIVEILCQWYVKLDDFYLRNHKNYTVVHLAKTAGILKKLYEYGIDLWIPDAKNRYPLFMNSFHGQSDCVSFLISIALYRQQYQLISSKDTQGDTALHAACLTGHIQCVSLLLYFIRDTYNSQGLLAYQLAEKAGHHSIAQYVYQVEQRKLLGETAYDIYQCSFDELSSITLYYGARWCKLYDVFNDEVYYYDRVLQISQWHRPNDYDEKEKDENFTDKIRRILKEFYLAYNPEKLGNINEIIITYKDKYNELFLQLADRYHVEDLSIFSLE